MISCLLVWNSLISGLTAQDAFQFSIWDNMHNVMESELIVKNSSTNKMISHDSQCLAEFKNIYNE